MLQMRLYQIQFPKKTGIFISYIEGISPRDIDNITAPIAASIALSIAVYSELGGGEM